MIFIKWIYDRLVKHIYWYSEPSKIWNSDKWGKVQVARGDFGDTFVYKAPGHAVKKKICKVCNRKVWSNNPKSICGNFKCWRLNESISRKRCPGSNI